MRMDVTMTGEMGPFDILTGFSVLSLGSEECRSIKRWQFRLDTSIPANHTLLVVSFLFGSL